MSKKISRLEQKRRALGMSQKDLAREIGVCPSLISMVETRRMKAYPKLRHRLAEILDCDETYLFGRD